MDMIQGRMDIAVKYGADVAIFVHNVVYWVEKNAANGVNFHDGRYWTYNSAAALCKLYPLWSQDQMKRLIKKCVELGVILTGNYNENQRDRTLWYTPSDEILELYGLGKIAPCKVRNRPMEDAESHHPKCEIAPPLPRVYQEETKIDTPYSPPEGDEPDRPKRKSKYDLHEDAKPLLRAYVGEDRELAQALAGFIEMRVSKRAINSKLAIARLLASLDNLSEGRRDVKLQLLDQSITNSWKGIFPLHPGVQTDAMTGRSRIVEERGTYEL